MSTKIRKWQEISRKSVFQTSTLKIEKLVFKLPDGTESDFYIKKECSTVAVVAITKNQKVILVKQYRPGPEEVLLELPGGYVDPNEKPEGAANRELLEETGYKGNIQLVSICLDDAYSTMRRYCFVATECEKVKNPQGENHEFLELKLLSLEDFRKLLRGGKMTDVEVGYLGLDFLSLLKDKFF